MASSVLTNLVDPKELREVELAARVEIATKVGRLAQKPDGDSDRSAALALARLLVEDTSVSVREALSRELRSCRFLPDDLIKKLCQDIDQVSMPFLMASQAVSDDYLESLIPDASVGVQEAVAQRASLSEQVSFAICDSAKKDAVSTLMDNKDADVSARAGKRVIERFPEERSLLEKLASRADLSVEVVEKLIFKVSRRYSEYLTERFNLSSDYSSYLTTLAQRQVFIAALGVSRQSEVENYFRQLHDAGGLNSELLLSFLQSGALSLFVSALAVLLDKQVDLIDRAVQRGNRNAVVKLLEAAGFSKSVIGAMSIAYQRHFRQG